MNEKVTSKSVIARDFIFRSNCMLGGRALPGPAWKAETLPRPSSRSGGQDIEHSLAAFRGALRRGGEWK